ncbi:MAG: acyl-ACP--UDP-N-acetylglucosamine O-acyltransferase [Gammaproteobacteria bacterium]
MIDSSAQIDSHAECGDDVTVGAFSIIGPEVKIASGCTIGSHVVIKGPTEIGRNTTIHSFCSIGEDPQDKKFDPNGESRLVIGANNTIREYCSINRGTAGGGGVTTLGDDNWIMAYCHIAHDCQVGNHVIFANNATLAGHVEIHDYAILGGFTGVHQFCRMGENSFSAISAVIVKDVPPFVIVDGNTARARAINREGLRRRGFDSETISALKDAFKTIYKKGLTLKEALDTLAARADDIEQVGQFLDFIQHSQRGIVR